MPTASKKRSKARELTDLPARAPRHRVRYPVEIADPNGVRNVIKGLLEGKAISRACSDAKVSQQAFWRRLLDDAALKREFAAAFMHKALDRSDLFSVGGNPTLLGTFAKLAKDTAASMSPADWGDKVHVQNQTLVIHTNLDFRVCETLDGIIASTDTPERPERPESDIVLRAEPVDL